MLKWRHIQGLALTAALLPATAWTQTTAPKPAPAQPAAATGAAAPASTQTDAGQDLPYTWVSPKFQAGPKQTKKITLVKHFPYTDMMYSPPVIVPPAPPDEGFKTPEATLFERFAAMRRLDYAEWLKTWDVPGQQVIAARNAQQNVTPEAWVSRWKSTLSANNVTLVRRVETGDYVILTYQVSNKPGQYLPAALELPVIFHKVSDQWLGTQDLIKDPLAPMSPWVSGKTEQKVTIR